MWVFVLICIDVTQMVSNLSYKFKFAFYLMDLYLFTNPLQVPGVEVPSKHINVDSTLKQCWSSTFINVVSTLIFVWEWKLSRRTFIDVVSTLAKQRWNNVDSITSIQRRWTNIVSTLKLGWKWKLSRRMFIDVVSKLTKQRWNKIDRITSIQRRWPNVVSTFIVS